MSRIAFAPGARVDAVANRSKDGRPAARRLGKCRRTTVREVGRCAFFQHKLFGFCLLQHVPGRAFSRRIDEPERWCIVRFFSPVRMALKLGLGAGTYR